MSVFSWITNVEHPAHREALKEVARRLATIAPVDPSVVTPSLSSNLDANSQRLTGLASGTQAQDLVTLSDVRSHVQAQLSKLYRSVQGLATPLG